MSTDLERWKTARTFAGLGELTAQWIEGVIAWQPAYDGPGDIDTPRMAEVLAKLNRAGYLTTQSQQALDGPGHDGKHWKQRAAVIGYATEAMASRIWDQAPAGVHVIPFAPHTLPRYRCYWGHAVTITWRDGRDYTEFGGHVSRRSICDPHTGYGLLHPDVQEAVCRAWQLTVIDTEPGRDDLLWDFLAGISDMETRA